MNKYCDDEGSKYDVNCNWDETRNETAGKSAKVCALIGNYISLQVVKVVFQHTVFRLDEKVWTPE